MPDTKQLVKDILDRECAEKHLLNKMTECFYYKGLQRKGIRSYGPSTYCPCWRCHENDKLTAEILDAVGDKVNA